MDEPLSFKEQRVRSMTLLHYSKPQILQAIFEFSKNREICPRYFEGFGKRPDSFQYKDDILQLAKKGATSFHCSEEIWEDPLKIETGMTPEQYTQIRIGWDFLIDIDSKYIDYSKVMLKQVLALLKFHGIKNVGIKFSGSKGFHMILPWKAFPKEVNGMNTKDLFPDLPRILLQYISEKTKPALVKEITKISLGPGSEYVRDYQASSEVIPDLVLVSPRHLFRMPYSLHEKTSLVSIVLRPEEIDSFDLKDADPMNLSLQKIRNFCPDCVEGEATELVVQALDWAKEKNLLQSEPEKLSGKFSNFKPIELKDFSEDQLPPCIKAILKGIGDGKKRALFVLINLFRSIGLEKEDMEKRIFEWNAKNTPPLRQGYIQAQLLWAYKRKPLLPPNCKEFYQGVGVCTPDNLCNSIKNPVNYVIRKNFSKKNNK